MDKNEQTLIIKEFKNAMSEKHYDEASKLADLIDVKKVDDNNLLSLIADAYELSHDYELAKDVLLLAYERTNAGRHLAFRLCLISIKTKTYDDAEDFYNDFILMAPKDTSRYVLQYKIAAAKNEPKTELIKILEEYVNIDMEEKWAYELAKLYKEVGDTDRCVEVCDEIGLWFPGGKYIKRAMELKKQISPLNITQQQLLEDGSQKESEEVHEADSYDEPHPHQTDSLVKAIMDRQGPRERYEPKAIDDLLDEEEHVEAFDIEEATQKANETADNPINEFAKKTFKRFGKKNNEKEQEPVEEQPKPRDTDSIKIENNFNVDLGEEVKEYKFKRDLPKPGSFKWGGNDMANHNMTPSQGDVAHATNVIEDDGDIKFDKPVQFDITEIKLAEPEQKDKENLLSARVSGADGNKFDVFDSTSFKKESNSSDIKVKERSDVFTQKQTLPDKEPSVIDDVKAVEDILQSLKDRGILGEDTVEKAVGIIDSDETYLSGIIEPDEPEEQEEHYKVEEELYTAELDIDAIREAAQEDSNTSADPEEISDEEMEEAELEELVAEDIELAELDEDAQSEEPEELEEFKELEESKELEQSTETEEPAEEQVDEQIEEEIEEQVEEQIEEIVVQEPVIKEGNSAHIEMIEWEEPVVEEPVEEVVVEEPAVEEVAEESVAEPVVEEPAVEEVAEEPVEEPVAEPTVEEQPEEPVETQPEETEDNDDNNVLVVDDIPIMDMIVTPTNDEVEDLESELGDIESGSTIEIPSSNTGSTVEIPDNLGATINVDAVVEAAQKEETNISEEWTDDMEDEKSATVVVPDLTALASEMVSEEQTKTEEPTVLEESEEPVAPEEPEEPEEPTTPEEPEEPEEPAASEEPEEPAEPEEPEEVEKAEVEEVEEPEEVSETEESSPIDDNDEDGEELETMVEESKGNTQEIEFKLTAEDMEGFDSYLNVEGLENKIKKVVENLVVNFEENGNSAQGNIVIVGGEKSGKTTMAIELIKLINRKRGRMDRRIAKIDAISFNSKSFEKVARKLKSCDLIIEDAHLMTDATLKGMLEGMKHYTDDMIVIIEGETKQVKQMFEKNPEMKTVFDNIIPIKQYNIKEWVAFGKALATEKGFVIDDMAELAFYKAIDDTFGKNKGISQADVEKIVEKAIAKRSKFKLFGVKKDAEGLKILEESDFN